MTTRHFTENDHYVNHRFEKQLIERGFRRNYRGFQPAGFRVYEKPVSDDPAEIGDFEEIVLREIIEISDNEACRYLFVVVGRGLVTASGGKKAYKKISVPLGFQPEEVKR